MSTEAAAIYCLVSTIGMMICTDLMRTSLWKRRWVRSLTLTSAINFLFAVGVFVGGVLKKKGL
jgi:hypothetical protein